MEPSRGPCTTASFPEPGPESLLDGSRAPARNPPASSETSERSSRDTLASSSAPVRNPIASSVTSERVSRMAVAWSGAPARNPRASSVTSGPSSRMALAVSGAPARNPAASSATGSLDLPIGWESDVALPNAFGCSRSSLLCKHDPCTTSQHMPVPTSFGLGVLKLSGSPCSQEVVSPYPVCSGDAAASSPPADPAQCSPPSGLPGSRASTFEPAGLWHVFFSCLGTATSDFSTFWHSVRSLPRPARGPLGRVWPMPVPFPSLHRAQAKRRQPDAARKLGLNALVLALSWLSLGCPAVAPSYLGAGAICSTPL